MKLTEQFKNADNQNKTWKQLYDDYEEIADKFAIGFAEWFDDLSEDYCKYYTVKQLLEIYKKEKGL